MLTVKFSTSIKAELLTFPVYNTENRTNRPKKYHVISKTHKYVVTFGLNSEHIYPVRIPMVDLNLISSSVNLLSSALCARTSSCTLVI